MVEFIGAIAAGGRVLRACEFFTTASDFPACHGIVSHPALFIEKFRILRLSFSVSAD